MARTQLNRLPGPVFAVLLLASGMVRADSWRFEPELVRESFRFGDVEIVRARDARADTRYPDHSIEVRRGGELKALYRGVSFQELFADEKNEVFVGLSNDGLPGTAIVVFRSSGELMLMSKHGEFRPEYCDESVTRVRHWFDSRRPEVAFEYETFEFGTYLRDIHVRLCDGKLTPMEDVRLGSHRRAIELAAQFDRDEPGRRKQEKKCAERRAVDKRLDAVCPPEATFRTVPGLRGVVSPAGSGK